MRTPDMLRSTFTLSFAVTLLAGSSIASAHTITLDGAAAEWSTRSANAPNVGMVLRDAGGHGEYAWRDATGDQRTDFGPVPELDIVSVQVTGGAVNSQGGLTILIRTAAPPLATSQFQVALDFDRIDGSGQSYFAGFADTRTSSAARWEYLVQTQFAGGAPFGPAAVWKADFSVTSSATAARGTDGVEIFVPWSAVGLFGPPQAPVRFTVADFYATTDFATADIGGASISNAIDVVSDYGDPRSSAAPSTWNEVSDGIVDYSFDAWFAAGEYNASEVYAPLMITRIVPGSSPAGGSGEWVTLRNLSPATIYLAGFRLGDEETPDGGEGMFEFPSNATITRGATFVVAQSGSAYLATFGSLPDAEFVDTLPLVPNMTVSATWSTGAFDLADGGDDVLILGPSNTVLDIVGYGAPPTPYAGLVYHQPAPATGHVLARSSSVRDTDDNQVDFIDAGLPCSSDATCSVCTACDLHACVPRPQGTSCSDGLQCNGSETCDEAGTCTAGRPEGDGVPCNDGDVCSTVDMCLGGVCVGTLYQVPDEVDDGVRVGRTLLTWNLANRASYSSILRGSLSHLPVGPGGSDESCFGPFIDTWWSDAQLPAVGAGYWYLVRGQSSCGSGPYGFEVHGNGEPPVPRASTTCP